MEFLSQLPNVPRKTVKPLSISIEQKTVISTTPDDTYPSLYYADSLSKTRTFIVDSLAGSEDFIAGKARATLAPKETIPLEHVAYFSPRDPLA